MKLVSITHCHIFNYSLCPFSYAFICRPVRPAHSGSIVLKSALAFALSDQSIHCLNEKLWDLRKIMLDAQQKLAELSLWLAYELCLFCNAQAQMTNSFNSLHAG